MTEFADTVCADDFGDPPNVDDLNACQTEVLTSTKVAWATWLTEVYFGGL
jgi:hypothetical protein